MNTPPAPTYDGIPQEIRDIPNWIVFRSVWNEKNGKWDKPPFSLRTGQKADHQAATSRVTFAEAVAAALDPRSGYAGIGFSLGGTEFTGIDLDHCADPDTGEIEEWARQIIREFDSYAEYSFSGTGVHILIRGDKPKGKCRTGDIECYSEGRYFTFTGRIVGENSTVEARQGALDAFCARAFPAPEPKAKADGRRGAPRPAGAAAPASEADRLDLARAAANGATFAALYDRGDLSGHGGDASLGDYVLCCILAFWLDRDHDAIDRAFRNSGLYRDKWDSRRGASTYGDQTIGRAIAVTSEVYSPPGVRATLGSERRQASGEAQGGPDMVGIMPLIAGQLAGLPVTLHRMGVTPGRTDRETGEVTEPTEKQYVQAIRRLFRVKAVTDCPLNFCLGDLYNQLPAQFGARKAWVQKHFGGGDGVYMQFRKLGHVAAAWPQDARKPGLPWSFFREAAALPPERRIELAREYEAGGHGVTVAAVQQEKAESAAPRLSKDLRAALASLAEVRGEEFAGQVIRAALGGRLDGIFGDDGGRDENAKNGEIPSKLCSPWEQSRPENPAENGAEIRPENGEKCPEDPGDGGDDPDIFDGWFDPDEGDAEDLSDPPPCAECAADAAAALGELRPAPPGRSAGDSVTPGKGGAPCSAIPPVIKIAEHGGAPDAPDFPPGAPVAECLREKTWGQALGRWQKFAGCARWDDTSPEAARMHAHVASLRRLWNARHPAPVRKESVYA